MASPSKNKNTCYACGEEVLVTGNYHVKILPSKRIPSKVKDLLRKKNEAGMNDAVFLKYKKGRLKKHLKNDAKALITNIMEITCGVCKSVSKIPMQKNEKYNALNLTSTKASASSSKSTPTATDTPTLTKSQKKKMRRSKTPKELNAGLIIPESMRTVSDEPQSKRPRLQSDGTPTTSKQTDQPQPQGQPVRGSNSTLFGSSASGTAQFISKPKQKSLNSMAEAQKQKQVHNLRKTLFKSKQMTGSASKSLQDFLS